MKLRHKKLLFHRYLTVFIILMMGTINCAQAKKSQILTQEQQVILATHNKFRQWHHAPPLVWDDELARYAERYASKCLFKHSGSPFGENLAAGYPSVSAAVGVWYAEHERYSYARPGFSYATGHFTQVVWRATQRLGCAYVVCDGKEGTPGNYLVCEYSPAGNIASKEYFSNNVLPKN